MRRHVPVLILLLGLLAGRPVSALAEDHPDRVIRQKTITGKVIRVEEGDYVHVVVQASSDKEESFFLGTEVCFLAQHLREPLTIQFLEVERYFPEGGGDYPANVIHAISVRGSKARWSAKNASALSPDGNERCLENLTALLAPPVTHHPPPD